MELVIRSLVDLKLQVEELRRRIDEERVGGGGGGWIGEPARELRSGPGLGAGGIGIEPPGAAAPPNVVTITPGMTMAAIERAAIEAALKETRGNRRKAAEMLGIGERTLYRKLREYQIPDPSAVDATGVLD
jgi:transcriptional regulator of acetoin/glycerol metabolism